MAYSSLTDIFVRYRPITTMVGTGDYDVTSAEVTSVFIAQSDGIIDGYLAKRYVVPLSTTPPLITLISADLSIHSMLAEKLPTVPEFIDKRYERAMNLLTAIMSGTMTLGNSVTEVTSAGDNYAWSPNMGYHPTFDPNLRDVDQAADIDRVNASKSEREDDSDNY